MPQKRRFPIGAAGFFRAGLFGGCANQGCRSGWLHLLETVRLRSLKMDGPALQNARRNVFGLRFAREFEGRASVHGRPIGIAFPWGC